MSKHKLYKPLGLLGQSYDKDDSGMLHKLLVAVHDRDEPQEPFPWEEMKFNKQPQMYVSLPLCLFNGSPTDCHITGETPND